MTKYEIADAIVKMANVKEANDDRTKKWAMRCDMSWLTRAYQYVIQNSSNKDDVVINARFVLQFGY
jgi:hypothetical protein